MTSDEDGSAKPLRWIAWAVAGAAAVLHVALALATDLSPDEAYYLCAARVSHPIADHPPLTAWLLALSDRWSAAPVELRVRIWAIAGSFATTMALVAAARSRGAGRTGCVLVAWVASFALLPTAGGFVTTPDTPLLLALALALLALDRSVLGACAALVVGSLAKVVALPIAGLLGLWTPGVTRLRRWCLALAPLLALPLLIPSLRFQLRHAFVAAPGAWSVGAAVSALGAAVGAQLLLWSPPVVVYGLRGCRTLPRHDQAVVLGLTALVVLSALVRGVPPEPNWWAPAALVMVIGLAKEASAMSPRALRASLLAVLLPTAVAAAHTLRPFLPLPTRADPTARLHGWRDARRLPEAPGVGPYGACAERCVYQDDCKEIISYFNQMNVDERSRP